MNAMLDILSSPAWRHLIAALLHTLWQGLLAAALLGVVLKCVSVHRPRVRYAAGLLSLLGVLFACLVTWSILDRPTVPDSTKPTISNRVGMLKSQEQHAPAAVFSSPSPTDANADAESAGTRSPWFAVAAAAWLLGVAVMVLRMIGTVWGLRRIAFGPELTDSAVRATVEQLQKVLRLKRLIRIVETTRSFGPAVLGVVRPVLVLPVSMATGLPPETLRAILAHELAHIRRHDYLFNLVQMVIESLLFFNPAVWWINRRIRAEREACCDALAASVLGESRVLAESLAMWAERVRDFSYSPSPAMAWSNGRPQLLLDRIRRICVPGYRPPLPISPLGFCGFLLLTFAVLSVLWRGTSVAVELAEKILTPQERVERIEQVERQYAQPKKESQSVDRKDTVVFKGTIRTYDDKPLPKRLTIIAVTPGVVVKGVDITPPSFTVAVWAGTTRLYAEIEGYAPAIVGPFVGEPGKIFSDIKMVFEKGTPRTIHVADENGKPVAGATIGYSTIIEGSYFGNAQRRTDDAGNFTLLVPPGASYSYGFNFSKPGFQTCAQRDVTLQADSPTTLTFSHAKPLAGELLSPEGRPVAGAKIRQYIKVSPTSGDCSAESGPVLAVTDARGQFSLDVLEDEATYLLVAESEEYGRQPIRVDATRPERLSVRFGPKLTISGVVRGPLDKLEKTDGKPSVHCSQEISLKDNHTSHGTSCCDNACVETVNGEQRFTFRNLLPGKLYISAGKNHTLETTVDAATPDRQVTIDLTRPMSPPQQRPVVLQLTTPDGSTPQGTIRVGIQSANGWSDKNLPIQEGVVLFNADVSRTLIYWPRGLVGYWFRPGQQKVEPGQEILKIVVPLTPAGAIAGRLFDADGKPYKGTDANIVVNYHWVSKTPAGVSFTDGGSLDANDARVDLQGLFLISPLPLGRTYAVTINCGHTLCHTKPIELSGVKPTVEVTLALPRTMAIEGRVLDSKGQPLVVPWELDCSWDGINGKSGNGWGGITDAQGRFRIDNVGIGAGEYAWYFKPRRNFQPYRVPVPLDGKPIEVRLKSGHVLEGTIIDDATDKPVAGVEITAMPAKLTPESMSCEAESTTDARGRFRFSNLGDQPYKMWLCGPQIVRPDPRDEPTWRPGEKDVVLRVIIPDDYRPPE